MAPKKNINNIQVTCGNETITKARILYSLKGLKELRTITSEMQTNIANQAIGLLTMPMDALEAHVPESDRIVDL